jgi:hypothetical protein
MADTALAAYRSVQGTKVTHAERIIDAASGVAKGEFAARSAWS